MSFPVRSETRFGFLRQYPDDLAACTVGALVAGWLVTTLPAGSRLRLAAALPLVCFLPGYALVAALFPASARAGRAWNPMGSSEREGNRSRPGGIDTAERFACALGLSIAIVPMAVIALAPTVGLTTEAVAAGLAGTTIVLAQVGVLRRLRVPEGDRYTASARDGFRRLRGDEGTISTASALFLVVGVAVALLALGAGVIAPQPTPGFTEVGLYTEDEGDLVADGFPDAIEPGESVPLVIAVENHERTAMNYTVVVEEQRVENGTVEDRTRLADDTLPVADGDRATTSETVTPTAGEGTVRIAVLLYEGDSPPDPGTDPVENVHVWVEVGEDGVETIDDAGNATVEGDDDGEEATGEVEDADVADVFDDANESDGDGNETAGDDTDEESGEDDEGGTDDGDEGDDPNESDDGGEESGGDAEGDGGDEDDADEGGDDDGGDDADESDGSDDGAEEDGDDGDDEDGTDEDDNDDEDDSDDGGDDEDE